jgi:hypothetical protein
MKARGKREAKRSASPLVTRSTRYQGLKGRNYPGNYALFRAGIFDRFTRGDVLRFASHLPLAFIFSAVGAANRIFCDFWGKAS